MYILNILYIVNQGCGGRLWSYYKIGLRSAKWSWSWSHH